MMTVFGMVFERHGGQLPVVNGVPYYAVLVFGN